MSVRDCVRFEVTVIISPTSIRLLLSRYVWLIARVSAGGPHSGGPMAGVPPAGYRE